MKHGFGDWLTLASQRLGINLAYFLPNAITIVGRYVTTTLLGFLLSIAFARLAEKEVFGQYQYVLSVVSLLSIFSLPGLNTAALRAFVEGDERALERSVRYSFFGSLIATVTLLGIGFYNVTHAQPVLGFALCVAGVLLPFYYAPNSWYVYYEGRLQFHPATLRIILLNVVLLAAMTLGLVFHLSLVGLITIYFGLNAAMTIAFFLGGRRTVKTAPDKNRLNLPYAFRCTLQKFTTTGGENIQMLTMSFVFGFTYLAIYQVAQSFVNIFNGLTSALSATYFPLLLKYKKLNHGFILIQNLGLGILFWIVYLAAVTFIFPPLYGAKYSEAVLLAKNLSFIMILVPLRHYLTSFFTARDRNTLITVTNLGANILALLLFLVCKDYGFFAAATVYLYTLNIGVTVPLLIAYLLTLSYKSKTP